MADSVCVRGYYGDQFVLVDGSEVLEMRTEAEARSFLEELGEKALESVDPRALPPGLRSDFEAAGGSRDDQLAVLAQMLSSGQFTVVRLQRPFGRLDPVKSVPLSSLRRPQVDEPAAPAKVKDVFAYEVRLVDELGEPIEGVLVSLSVSGSSRRLMTDADGRVKVDDGTSGTPLAGLPEVAALQEALRLRWAQVRGGTWLEEAENHTCIDCSAPLPSVQVRAGRVHTIVVQPRVICARILELLFDTNKAFLLPAALEHIRAVRKLYDQRTRAKVLIVGHTDVTGEPNVNDPLSLNRAKAVAAYLRDDVKTWLEFYDDHMHPKTRWGSHEDQLMLHAVLVDSGEKLTDAPLRHFQATRGLEPDGKLGPITREALITEYMAIDGTTLPADIEPIIHGCGENFPLGDEPGQAGKPDAHDRRVELFFFDGDLGVLPHPAAEMSSAGSAEYPEWRRRSVETFDFVTPVTDTLQLVIKARLGFDETGLENASFVLRADDGVVVHRQANVPRDEQGRTVVEFKNLSPSGTYSLSFEVETIEIPVLERLSLVEATNLGPETTPEPEPAVALESSTPPTVELLREALVLARISEDVYQDTPSPDLNAELFEDDKERPGVTRFGPRGIAAMRIDPDEFSSLSGFSAGLYQLGDGTFVLANRGTTPTDIRDYITDLRQGAGSITIQYDQALRLAGILTKRLGSDLLITGHSLGGGLAAVQALEHGCRAVTFNAAGVHDNTMKTFWQHAR